MKLPYFNFDKLFQYHKRVGGIFALFSYDEEKL